MPSTFKANERNKRESEEKLYEINKKLELIGNLMMNIANSFNYLSLEWY